MTDDMASRFDVVSAASTVSPLATMAAGNVGGRDADGGWGYERLPRWR